LKRFGTFGPGGDGPPLAIIGSKEVPMLSDSARPVIESTLPLMGANIVEIAQRFYRHMFADHPELLDGVFNRGNQADGAQQQALAGSVAAFATTLLADPDRPPERLLSRIAHKHASLGISPAQYQLVHDNLMWAIVDVLGPAVTPAVAAAWDEVYWLMANALMNIERGLYSARGVGPETVWGQWRVTERIDETDDVVTFVVEQADRRLARASLPGQYVTVMAAMPDGTRQPRPYSLTRSDDGLHRQFAVKRVHEEGRPDGEVSTLLHRTVHVDDVLTLSVPYGDVVLDDSGQPVVFVSAGIGITPTAGMLSHLVNAGTQVPVRVLHADVSEAAFALRTQVEKDVIALADASMQVWYEPDLMDLTGIDLPAGARFYLCGPLPFMRHVRGQLLARGVAPEAVHYEVFGPDLWQADTV
jgi:nitric oxide dioxygenase